MAKRGRPFKDVKIFQDNWSEVCHRIVEGESLDEICKSLEVSPSRARRWIQEDPKRVLDYNQAYTMLADTRADKVDALAKRLEEEGKNMTSQEVNAIKTAIDALRWSAGVKNQRKYADRKTLEIEQNQTPEQAKEELRLLREQFGEALQIIEMGGKAPH